MTDVPLYCFEYINGNLCVEGGPLPPECILVGQHWQSTDVLNHIVEVVSVGTYKIIYKFLHSPDSGNFVDSNIFFLDRYRLILVPKKGETNV